MTEPVTKVAKLHDKAVKSANNLITGKDPAADKARKLREQAANAEQSKIDKQLLQDEIAMKTKQSARDLERRKMRAGETGKRSLLTGSFAGVKKNTLG